MNTGISWRSTRRRENPASSTLVLSRMFPLKTLVIAAVLAAVLVNIMPDEQAMETGRSTVRAEGSQLVVPVQAPVPDRAV